ncbi:MAG: nucleotidyltransferase substrate binding protein [Opitutaceae bacterium]|jgi:nucleotidyltransferase substrate binding protein (TIGR01987 family)|nr:nucleotidyltransferase substrate binding protein [Opitutaceae bacterium]
MNNPLDCTSLEKAVISLGRAVATFRENEKNAGENLAALLRAGVIQNFEITYELSWKMMARWLNENITPSAATGISRRELFRLAAQNGLITDVAAWFAFHEDRNSTSHTYNETNALEVFESAQKFHPFAKSLLENLKARS